MDRLRAILGELAELRAAAEGLTVTLEAIRPDLSREAAAEARERLQAARDQVEAAGDLLGQGVDVVAAG